jgi:integrase
MTIYKLRTMAEILDPHHALDWLEDIEFDLRADAVARTRNENFTSDQLLEVGETLFREAENASHLSPKDRAVLARNGLMIALLAVHPIRHKNLAQLTLGKSFRKDDERWWIILEAAETKGRRADERQVPEYLTPLVDRYLAIFRPILIEQKASETGKIEEAAFAPDDQPAGPLWISRAGGPLTYSGVGAAITETTGAVLGQRLSPHAFRRAAKATVTFFGTANPRMIQGVLQHQTFRTGDEYYDTSPSHRAALELTAIVRALMQTG